MPTKTITLGANNIDDAAEQIIYLLEDTDKGGGVIYFHGWSGWGASAVLKEVVKRLRSSLGSTDTGTAGGLEKIIHVDFSPWQSKRSLQKAIAEELELPQQVMTLFDQRDEEDDFDGVEQSSRDVIPLVNLGIMKELSDRRFLVVLHNWSGNYIDLRDVGVPVIRLVSKTVLWTSRGRFWPHVTARHDEQDEVEKLAGLSDAAINLFTSGEGARNILYAEIEEVAKCTGVPEPDMSLNSVIECILYMAARGNDQDISWESHASNYWVCDGIIHDATDGGRSAWEISDALQRNMNLDLCNECAEEVCELLSGDQWRHKDRWVSLTSQNSMKVEVPSLATSLFCTRAGSSSGDHDNGAAILEADLFEHSNWSSLRVMHLSYCNFSFSSPPFLRCCNLRFLLVDHCKDMGAQDRSEEKECHWQNRYSKQDGGSCFRNLWVLELSYTDWYCLLSKYMLDLMVDLRELNVKGIGKQSMMHLHNCSGAGSNRRRVIKLRVVADDSDKSLDNDDGTSGKKNQQVSSPVVASSFFPDLSSWHILKTVILDGCSDLEQIDCNALPLSLESFTLHGSVPTSSKIKRISFQGHTRLKSILLRGLFDSLVELDMSGTTIRTLDLSVTQARGLRRLFLLGCEKLCAILFPLGEYVWLEILRIDTTTATYAAWNREEGKSNKQEATASDSASISIGSSSAIMYGKDRTIIDSDFYVSIRDPRLFRSLVSLRYGKGLHVEISSTGPSHEGTGQGINTVNVQKPGGSLYADDIIISTSIGSNSQANDDANKDAFNALLMGSKWLWDCPPIPEDSDWGRCYISIQDEAQTKKLQVGTATSTTLPPFVRRDSVTLHLHDSLSITCLPGPTPPADADLGWYSLKWCRLERCPNLEGTVFTPPQQDSIPIFWHLETFWASELPEARYIWDWSTASRFHPEYSSFEDLVFLHLDNCPRLVHVLPLYTSNVRGCHSLETLEIVCCGDLREVFPSDSKSQQHGEPREFPRLKRIHLYELPKLQRICGSRMLAPNLETIKIRGCWSLRRLPVVGHRCGSTPPVVDCEDWWDGLEWDGESAGHHPSHYKPSYSGYYKKKQLRASVLR